MVVMPGGRAESAHRLRNLMVVQAVPLGRGWYFFAWGFLPPLLPPILATVLFLDILATSHVAVSRPRR